MDTFIKYRAEAGVFDDNDYLFGVPTSSRFLDASSVLRKFSISCNAENPSLLRSTYLRKQVATLAQLLTMNDNQIAQVAKLMGHIQKVHEAVYRQDEQLFQVTSWAKFLTIVSSDEILHYKGKSFEEILQTATSLEPLEDNPNDEDHFGIEDILPEDMDVGKLIFF